MYDTVGWLFHDLILLLAGAGDRDEVMLHERGKGLAGGPGKGEAKEKACHLAKAAPPLPLPAPGQVGEPHPCPAAMFNNQTDFHDRGAEPAEVA